MIEKKRPLFSIITPTFNSAERLQNTIISIRNQSCKDFEYIVIDGNSTDNTAQIIKDNIDIIDIYISEQDSGMYEALVKGFKASTGRYCAYINAGDLYMPYCLEVVKNAFENNSNAKWITGLPTIRDNNYYIKSLRKPFTYNKNMILEGWHNGKYLSCIQQESVFWSRELLPSH